MLGTRIVPVVLALMLSLPLGVGDRPDYARDIHPILKVRCYSCHGDKVHMHGLRLDANPTRCAAATPARLPSLPAALRKSLLFKYVAGMVPDVIMPPTGELSRRMPLRAGVGGSGVSP